MLSDDEVSEVLVNAIINSDIVNLDVEELGELAKLQFMNDPDAEFVDIDFTSEAGLDGHGVNTEDEMLHTLGD